MTTTTPHHNPIRPSTQPEPQTVTAFSYVSTLPALFDWSTGIPIHYPVTTPTLTRIYAGSINFDVVIVDTPIGPTEYLRTAFPPSTETTTPSL